MALLGRPMREEPVLPIMRFFSYRHLPEDLQKASKPFADLAWDIHDNTPPSHEKNKCLDALLVAKDAAVRAVLPPS